jgi:hypothetical protein
VERGSRGIVPVGCLLSFYLIHIATTRTLLKGWAWLTFAAPGFLFPLCWYRSRKADTTPA